MATLTALSRPLRSSSYPLHFFINKPTASLKKRSMSSSKPPSPFSSYLIAPHSLHTALQSAPPTSNSRLVPICGTWFLPNDPQKRTGHSTYLARRIPGARFFDLDAISDTSSPYPHMLPSPAHFASSMGKLGLRNNDTLVVYDSAELGIFSAPRVAWQLRVMGHRGAVHLLDNFKVWVEQGLPTEGPGEPGAWEETVYEVPERQSGRVVDFEGVKARARSGDVGKGVQVLDARSEGRWKGTEPEPRPGEYGLVDDEPMTCKFPERLRKVANRAS